MKRDVFHVLRRAFDNTVMNWPLLLIRVVEGVVFVILAILCAIAVIVPVLVSIGIHIRDFVSPDGMENALASMVNEWPLLLWILVAALILVVVMVAVHSVVEAGCARVYVDAERVAGPAKDGARARFKVFSMARWAAGAKDGWWSVFWIYNYAWSVAGLILLIPLLPTLALMIVFRETPGILAGTGCAGIVVTSLLFILVAIVTGIWTNRAVAEWATHRVPASTALSLGWAAFKRDLGRHLLVALAMLVVAMAGSSVLSSFGFFASFADVASRHSASVALFTMPARLIGTLLNMAFSAAVAGWYLAAYSSMATE